MSKDPEEVHPENCRSAGLGIEEMASQVSIDEQHDLSGRQRSNRNQNHSRHHKVHPHQQRHAIELHTRASQAENCRNDIDGRSDASEAGDEQRESPIVGTMTGREGSRAQWRVRPPTNIRCASGAIQTASSEKAEIKMKCSEKGQPKTESIQARKSHVARTD